jgi:hypothetical protein
VAEVKVESLIPVDCDFAVQGKKHLYVQAKGFNVTRKNGGKCLYRKGNFVKASVSICGHCGKKMDQHRQF